jgi:hypothetical protein
LEAKLIEFQHFNNGIEPVRGWKDAYQNRRPENLYPLLSIRTAGAGIVEACTKLRWPLKPANSPCTRCCLGDLRLFSDQCMTLTASRHEPGLFGIDELTQCKQDALLRLGAGLR